jgi:hypothetical protein
MLQKLEFLDMVMFLQHLPTSTWAHHEVMVLSQAYMWHTIISFARIPLIVRKAATVLVHILLVSHCTSF